MKLVFIGCLEFSYVTLRHVLTLPNIQLVGVITRKANSNNPNLITLASISWILRWHWKWTLRTQKKFKFKGEGSKGEEKNVGEIRSGKLYNGIYEFVRKIDWIHSRFKSAKSGRVKKIFLWQYLGVVCKNYVQWNLNLISVSHSKV